MLSAARVINLESIIIVATIEVFKFFLIYKYTTFF